MSSRAIDEYLTVLADAAFGAATEVTPKFTSPTDPAARWTGAHGGQAFFAYPPTASSISSMPSSPTWRPRRRLSR
jgi:hypothetical protein